MFQTWIYPCKILQKLKVQPDSFTKYTQLLTRSSKQRVFDRSIFSHGSFVLMLYSSIYARSLPYTARICNKFFMLVSIFSVSQDGNNHTKQYEKNSPNNDFSLYIFLHRCEVLKLDPIQGLVYAIYGKIQCRRSNANTSFLAWKIWCTAVHFIRS